MAMMGKSVSRVSTHEVNASPQNFGYCKLQVAFGGGTMVLFCYFLAVHSILRWRADLCVSMFPIDGLVGVCSDPRVPCLPFEGFGCFGAF